MRIYTFRTIIEPDEKKTFHGFVPSLPGCHTWGKTLEETKKNLKEAIEVYVASLIADRQPVPRETGLEFFETISEKELKPVMK
jgi:predicted RNase H-like HicB family nuclease